jgi:metal-responsive CopG/Arc/MetJ family transcriptional regulator
MSGADRDTGKKQVTGVSIEKGLLDWADNHYGDLGYRSRSDLLNDQLHRLREAYRDEQPNAEQVTERAAAAAAADTEDTDE